MFGFLGSLAKDPKMQALLAAGTIAATGGAAAPAVAGAAAGAGGAAAGGLAGASGLAAAGTMGPMLPVAGAPLLDAAGLVIPSAGPSMGGLLGGFAEKVKPFTDAAKAANSMGGLLGSGPAQPVQGQAPPQTEGGGGLAQLYSSIQGDEAKNMEAEMQRRAKQQETLKRFGGGYGFT